MAQVKASSDIIGVVDGQIDISEAWKSFLTNPKVGLKPGVTAADPATSSPAQIHVTFDETQDLKQFRGLKFSSANNLNAFKVDSPDVPGSVLLSLPKTPVPNDFGPKLSTAIESLGFLPNFGLSVPDDFGNIPIPGPDGLLPDTSSTESLLAWLFKKIGGENGNTLLTLDTEVINRHGIWLSPAKQKLSTAVALTLKPSGEIPNTLLGEIQKQLASFFKIQLQPNNNDHKLVDLQIFLRRTCDGTTNTPGQDINLKQVYEWNITTSYQLGFRFQVGTGLVLWVNQKAEGMSITISAPGGYSKLLSLSPIEENTIKPPSNLASFFTDRFKVLQLTVGKKAKETPWWRVKIALQAQSSDANLYFQYDSRAEVYEGGLIVQGFFATDEARQLQDYTPGEALDKPPPSSGVQDPPKEVDVKKLTKELQNLPEFFPTVITKNEVVYKVREDELKLILHLVHSSPPPKANDQAVPDPLEWKELVMVIEKKGQETLKISGGVFLELKDPRPADPQHVPTGSIELTFEYVKGDEVGAWRFGFQAEELSGALLAGAFGGANSNSLRSTIGKLNIKDIVARYTYDKDGSGVESASSFAITGTVVIGTENKSLQLRMMFLYNSSNMKDNESAAHILKKAGKAPDGLPSQLPDKPQSGSEWHFECDLKASQPDQKLGDILAGITGGAPKDFPSFIANIDFPTATQPNDRGIMTIKAQKEEEEVAIAFRVTLGSFTMSYTQISQGQKTNASANPVQPKRLLRFSCDQIPLIKDIPLLDELVQPFDKLEYLWLIDDGDDGGLKSNEVKRLNETVLRGHNQLSYRQTIGQGAKEIKVKPETTAIVPGHHFMVFSNNVVVIDHVFHTSGDAQTASLQSSDLVTTNEVVMQDEPQPAQTSPPSKGGLNFSYGPLTVSAIELQFKEAGNEQYLWITMDATFALGPATSPILVFNLLGFAIGVPLSAISLDKISKIGGLIKPRLDGLGFAFDKPPLTLAGGFEHQKVNGNELYRGGVTIGFPPYTFIGVGEYRILDNFKSVFIYARLDGPLMSLGVATISGVRLGLGFNSFVRTPTINEITQFPFINDKSTAGAGNNPIAILNQIMKPPSGVPWVSPKIDSYWFAAGLTLEAFEIISVTAVAMIAFRDSGLVVSFFADAIAQMPPHVKDTAAMIIYVEIGLMAEMNFADGYFMVAASIAPTSFLLVSACRLYGGFAMTYWFAPNEHAGDWVFTVGGYHPKYEPPAWYPRPNRLGISFVTFGISIVGEAYFAITPKVLMGGALIRATLSVGPVKAWLETQFDALINLHPLHYSVSFRVSVGIECHIEFWFVDIHVSVSIGAQLEIFGPDFGGSAYVDFYLFAFTVDFGASPAAPPALNLFEFWKLVHRPGPETKPVNDKNSNPISSRLEYNNVPQEIQDRAAFKFVLEDGNAQVSKKADPNDRGDPESTGDGVPWNVKSGTFRFRINSDFAFNHVVVSGDPPYRDKYSGPEIQSRPMHVSSGIDSTLTVTIYDKESRAIISQWQTIKFDVKQVPQASWGTYSTATDPMSKNVDQTALLGNNKDTVTVALPMGIVVSAPPPELAPSLIPKFNALNYMVMGILDFRGVTPPSSGGKEWYMPDVEPTQTIYLAAPLKNQEDELPKPQRYQSFKETWEGLVTKQGLVNDAKEGLLKSFQTWMEWDKDRPQVGKDDSPVVQPAADGDPAEPPVPPAVVDTDAWKLKGDLPVRLLARFDDKYLELPRMAVV